MKFSTAAKSDLAVFCIEDPEAFRDAVIAAKRALSSRGPPVAVAGLPKDAAAAQAAADDTRALVAVLERIEAAMAECARVAGEPAAR